MARRLNPAPSYERHVRESVRKLRREADGGSASSIKRLAQIGVEVLADADSVLDKFSELTREEIAFYSTYGEGLIREAYDLARQHLTGRDRDEVREIWKKIASDEDLEGTHRRLGR